MIKVSTCPYLRKQLMGGFTCYITKSKIMPEYFEKYCSGSYVDCQYYRVPEIDKPKISTHEVKNVNEPIHVKIIDKQSVTSEKTNVVTQQNQIFNVSELYNLLNELENAWHQYETKATEIIKRWEAEREKIIAEILKEHSALDSIIMNEEELEGRKLLGLIKDEEYNVLKIKINDEKKIVENKIKSFIDQIVSFEKKINQHRERLHLTLKQQDLETLNKKLADLESMREKGVISGVVYEKLKREINAQIGILNEIYKTLNLTTS